MMIKNKKKLLFLCLLVILIATAYISFVTGTIKLSLMTYLQNLQLVAMKQWIQSLICDCHVY